MKLTCLIFIILCIMLLIAVPVKLVLRRRLQDIDGVTGRPTTEDNAIGFDGESDRSA